MRVQCFTNAFFFYLNRQGICSSLDALVMGMHCDGMHIEDDKTFIMVPKRCFVEGHQIDTLGCRKMVAVSVSGYHARKNRDDGAVVCDAEMLLVLWMFPRYCFQIFW